MLASESASAEACLMWAKEATFKCDSKMDLSKTKILHLFCQATKRKKYEIYFHFTDDKWVVNESVQLSNKYCILWLLYVVSSPCYTNISFTISCYLIKLICYRRRSSFRLWRNWRKTRFVRNEQITPKLKKKRSQVDERLNVVPLEFQFFTLKFSYKNCILAMNEKWSPIASLIYSKL